jgi:hypothetical protein
MEDLVHTFVPHCGSEEKSWLKSQMLASRNEWMTTVGIRLILKTLRHRFRLIELEYGYLGIGPLCTKPGDRVCIIHGCQKLLLVREYNKDYKFVGECFVLGLMNGEMQELIQVGKASKRRIALV